MQSRLDERRYVVETPQYVVRCSLVQLLKTNEPSPPSSDQAPAEVFVPVCPQSNELLTTVPKEVTPPAPSQEDIPLSKPEVAPAAAESPPKSVLRRSELQRRPTKAPQ